MRLGNKIRYLAIPLLLLSQASFGLASEQADKKKLESAQNLLTNWQLEDSFKIMEELLMRYPQEPGVAFLAGQVQLERGHYRSALSMIEYASAAGTSTGYVEGVVRSSGGYAEHFQSIQTPHFIISYLGKDEIVAHYAREVLEPAYNRIGKELGLFPAERGQKINVEIYPTARGLSGATGLTIDEIETSGTIAVCKFNKLMVISPLATANGYGWADTLAHEFIHLVISKKSRNSIPIWLHEGIAKFYESSWNGAPGRALKPYSQKLLADAIQNNEFITFEQMHPSMAKLPSQEAAGLAFAEVFTVIEFLRKRYGRNSIPKLLRLAGQGVELEQAFVRIYGLNLEQLEKTWREYVKKRPLKIFPGAKPERIRLSANDANHDSQKPLETIEDPKIQNFARLGELLQLRNYHKAAIIEYEKAYQKSENKYPGLVNRLARAYVSAKNYNKAQTILTKLLRVHPEDTDARLVMGRLQIAKKQFSSAKKHFEAVRLRNPFNPEIHEALALLYREENQPELANLETRFLELSRTRRSQRQFAPLNFPTGTSSVTLVPKKWGKVLIDGEQVLIAPIYNWSLEPGMHRVEYEQTDGENGFKEFTVQADKNTVVILD